MNTLLAAVGDSNNSNTFGGTPYYLLEAGVANGLIDRGLRLHANARAGLIRRAIWSAGSILAGETIYGFQYSDHYLTEMWRNEKSDLSGSRIINLFQLYPNVIAKDGRISRWYYIDQTLSQLFSEYRVGVRLGDSAVKNIVRREGEQYQTADGIVTTSEWARRSVIAEYGIVPSKVHVVVRGANFSVEQTHSLQLHAGSSEGKDTALDQSMPLKLIFIGKEWWRKGLDRLIGAVRLARLDGPEIVLEVFGLSESDVPLELRGDSWVTWWGNVDKETRGGMYLKALRCSHVGCLLSRHEAGGISLREFHLAGLATMVSDVGGSREFALESASTVIRPEATVSEIAMAIRELACDRVRLKAQMQQAAALSHTCSWSYAAERLARIIN